MHSHLEGRMLRALAAIVIIAGVLSGGCGEGSTGANDAEAGRAAAAQTLPTRGTPTATSTSVPTTTPPPTWTLMPTSTPTATVTPIPTRGSVPTATPWNTSNPTEAPPAEPTTIPPTQPAAAGLPQPQATASAAEASDALVGRLVFQLSPGGIIYTINADGSDLVRLTHGLDPVWSPDGRQVAFARHDVPRGLWLIHADGTGDRLLFAQGLLRTPAWTPDGSQIVFTRQEGGKEPHEVCYPPFGCFEFPGDPYWRLGVVDVFDGGFRDVPSDLHSNSPVVMPDGQTVIYVGDDGLTTATLADGARSVLREERGLSSPALSPDGWSIVYMSYLHDHWDLFMTTADGAAPVRLTSSSAVVGRAANNVAPTWSPDGRHLAFLSDRDGEWRLYIMNRDGSEQRPFLSEALSGLRFDYQFVHERVVDWGP